MGTQLLVLHEMKGAVYQSYNKAIKDRKDDHTLITDSRDLETKNLSHIIRKPGFWSRWEKSGRTIKRIKNVCLNTNPTAKTITIPHTQ